MPIKSMLRFVGTIMTAIILWGAVPAQAGFQWTPAPTPTPTTPTSVLPAPVVIQSSSTPTTSSSATASPLVISGNTSGNSAASNSLPPQSLGTLTATPASPSTEAALPPLVLSSPTADQTANTTTSGSTDVVHGFANRVPLTVALRQLLPPSYSYSVEGDVDLGVMVSFKGGKPWRATLQDMLSTVGLVMREQGQMITVSRVESSPSASAPASPAIISNDHALMTPLPGNVLSPASPSATLPMTQNAMTPGITSPQPFASSVTPTGETASLEKVSAVETWSAERGDSLRKVLDSWSRHAHVELEWLAEYDYPLQATINFMGSYEDAVRSLLSGFEEAHPQPVAQLHTNLGLGKMVLVVRTRGNTNQD